MEAGVGVSHLTGAGNPMRDVMPASLAATLIQGKTGVPRQHGIRFAIRESDGALWLHAASDPLAYGQSH
jgi:hypothetical protein